MSKRDDSAINFWAPRVGVEAARLRAAGRAMVGQSFIPLVGFLIVYGLGAKMHVTWIEVVGYAIGFIALGLVVTSFLFQSKYRKVASRRLGVHVGWLVSNDIPLSPAKYEEWCRRHGLEPYSANDSPST